MLAAYSSIALARRSRLEGRLLAILDPRRSRRRLTLVLVLLAALVPTQARFSRGVGVQVGEMPDPCGYNAVVIHDRLAAGRGISSEGQG